MGLFSGTTLKPGDAAPLFTLKDQTGKEVSLASLRGKRVVLYFYPKADTPG
jgi:peroxiredoxin Q/BCP